MPKSTNVLLAAALLAATGAWAQAAPQSPSPQQPQQPQAADNGFFRPSNDIRLAPPTPRPAAPEAQQAPAAAMGTEEAELARRMELARLERMEASMDRIESRNQRALEEANRQLPAIASPTDGTARIMSPLDGTAPLVSGLGR